MQTIIKLILLANFIYPSLAMAQVPERGHGDGLVEKFLNSMGGREVWSQTRTLHVKEKMWAKQSSEEITQEIWRDLAFPRTRLALKSLSMNRVRVLDISKGWGLLETGRYYEFDSIRIKGEVASWKRDLYTICRKIALNDEQLTFKEKQESIIEISEKNGQALCWIELNESGAPIKWTSKNIPEEEIIIYGPLRQFGAYFMPEWWTSQDGHWRFAYLEVNGSKDEPKVSFQPVKKED